MIIPVTRQPHVITTDCRSQCTEIPRPTHLQPTSMMLRQLANRAAPSLAPALARGFAGQAVGGLIGGQVIIGCTRDLCGRTRRLEWLPVRTLAARSSLAWRGVLNARSYRTRVHTHTPHLSPWLCPLAYETWRADVLSSFLPCRWLCTWVVSTRAKYSRRCEPSAEHSFPDCLHSMPMQPCRAHSPHPFHRWTRAVMPPHPPPWPLVP